MKNQAVEPNFKLRNGFIVAIIQDDVTNEVLMQAYMNPAAWKETIDTGVVVFWSTSRKQRWFKGETSGNVMLLKRATLDCDRDTALLRVIVLGDGLACHENKISCFNTDVEFTPNTKFA